MKNFILNEGYHNNRNIYTHSKGSFVFINKKKFIDLGCNSGANLLGHNTGIHKKIYRNFIKKNISNISSPNIHCLNFSKTLQKNLPYFSKFIFCNSGSESIVKAVRIAKAISKKDLVVSATGSWHGSVDQFLYGSNNRLKKIPLSDGLSEVDKKRLILIPYNNIKLTKKILLKNKKNIACIVIEPIQGCLPLLEAKKYLKFLSKFAKDQGLLLIFDEMITGLRTNGGTVQSLFNIKTDISTFGKCYGGGSPLGFVAISKKIDKIITKKNISVYFGGTFSGNSQNMFFSNESLKFILKNKKKIFNKINSNAQMIEKEINKFCEKNSIDAKMYRFTSMLRLVYSSKLINNRFLRDFLEKEKNSSILQFKKYLYQKKIFYPGNGIAFVSNSLSKKNVGYIIKTINNGLKKFF